jgi:uncharacterized protein YneF (UPF0154 family)
MNKKGIVGGPFGCMIPYWVVIGLLIGIIITSFIIVLKDMDDQIKEYKGNITEMQNQLKYKPQCAQIRVLYPFDNQQPTNGKPVEVFPCCEQWNINNQSDIVIKYNKSIVQKVYQDNNFIVFKQIGNYSWDK